MYNLFSGVRCETKCQPGMYGVDCKLQCNCLNNSSCDPESGDCVCSRGWTGPDCSLPCPDSYYGQGCKEKCIKVSYGNQTCDHVTGTYVCRPGYIGLGCQHACPTGSYGPNCGLKCECKNGGECSHENGQCFCPPGWTGSICNVSCPNGTYGPNCSHSCKCRNSGKCRKNDGHCICDAGWTGTRCEDGKLNLMFLNFNFILYLAFQFAQKDFGEYTVLIHVIVNPQTLFVMQHMVVCVAKDSSVIIAIFLVHSAI
jgi:multiple epidermal growth factor-like domains protein 10/11